MTKNSKVFAVAVAVLTLAIGAQVARAETLTRSLELGMSGADVSSLQTFLALDATIYPQGTVTGYFGFLTKAAVSNFQVRNNIANVGRVGPVTLVAINAQMAGGSTAGADIYAPIFSNVNVNRSTTSATVSWSTNELTRGKVFCSTTPLSLGEHATTVDVSGYSTMTDSNLHTSQSVAITGLQANTTYYYTVYSTDDVGNVSITWPQAFNTTN